MQALILILCVSIIIYFIWDIRENFYVNPYFMWAPTRSTRLMSYDIRGDPFSYFVYPPYFSWTAPFSYYLYNGDRYDISGRYLIPKRYKINIEKRNSDSKNDPKKESKKV